MKKFLTLVLIFSMITMSCSQQTVWSESNSDETIDFPDQEIGFTSLSDPALLQYVEDSVYANLEGEFSSDDYIIEDVSAIYLSKEYLEEIAYNSQENIYFGYTLSELDAWFEGARYVFSLGDDGNTIVQPFETITDDTYSEVLKNVAIGTGVILICVTVSVVTAGAGAPVVSAVFAASVKQQPSSH